MRCPKCNLEGYDQTNEWSHSACFKTQSEIEAHYTEANFPSKSIRYGSRAGKISPYPKTDGRSKAYYDK